MPIQNFWEMIYQLIDFVAAVTTVDIRSFLKKV